ncbi:MAG: Dabb family protein [Christensenellaceae bacterium]|nr:Dabb family protein [Christensenellaceae bacterium]
MVRHIVCFKLKDNSPENCEKAKEVLMSMKGNVELLRDIEVGIDFLHSERSYDLILQVVVDDKDALDAYQKHPYHVEVVKKHMHAVRSASVAVDYYFD